MILSPSFLRRYPAAAGTDAGISTVPRMVEPWPGLVAWLLRAVPSAVLYKGFPIGYSIVN